ncbi:hypothetical protein [Streptomyces sp. AC558_RSS880]|nr:hypothetical protein [Streptomyces sp. AC558_RSS880]
MPHRRRVQRPAAALEAVEREFGLGVDPQAVAGPLPSVIVTVRAD